MDRPTTPDPHGTLEDQAVRQLFEPAQAAYRAGQLAPDRADAVWAAIQTELDGPRQRPARSLWLVAAAALLLGVAGTLAWTGVGSDQARPSTASPAPPDIGPVAEAVRSPITLPSEARIEPIGGPVQVLEASRDRTRLAVNRSAVRSTVPPLSTDGGAYYLVQTPLAEVSVLGTVFTVKDGDDGATTVSVTEGRVQISPNDGRPAHVLLPGQTLVLEPVTAEGAARAQERDEWTQAAWIWRRLAEQRPEPLARENALLRAGRRLAAAPATVQYEHWRAAYDRHPDGVHAEQFLFGMGDALHRAGDAGAQAIGERFRRRFPNSARVEQTRRW